MKIFQYLVMALVVFAFIRLFFFSQPRAGATNTGDGDDDASHPVIEVNPANGLPMMGGVDINGNPSGVDDD